MCVNVNLDGLAKIRKTVWINNLDKVIPSHLIFYFLFKLLKHHYCDDNANKQHLFHPNK